MRVSVRRGALALALTLLFPPPSTVAAARAAADGDSVQVAMLEEQAYLRLYFPEEQVVETATRHPKSLSLVAENVSVITADQIRDMNAHTLADALQRVIGIYAESFGIHFGATVLPHIQGSGTHGFFGGEERHVLILLDGVPWSSDTAGPFLDTIPVGIVERIEVVKGPASATWGSSLGGVINVLTKPVSSSTAPRGELAGSAGERHAFDGRVEAAGGAGPLGYYLQGQAQQADWDDAGARFEAAGGYGKVAADLGGGVTLGLSGGYYEPEFDSGHLATDFVLAQQDERAAHARVWSDWVLGPAFSLHAAGYLREQRTEQYTQEDGTFAPRGELLQDAILNETASGFQGRVAWTPGSHTVVLGVDYAHQRLEQDVESGAFFQGVLGFPPRFEISAVEDRWGLYLNDTLALGRVTLTPGLRYDDSSRREPFWSPSLGGTLVLGRDTVLRVQVARGFGNVPLNFVSGGSLSVDPNPDLDPEVIWSYQAGVESSALRVLWLKVNAFRHEVSDTITIAPGDGPRGQTWINSGTSWRTGFDAEAETAPVGNFSLLAGFGYVRRDTSGEDRDQDQHQVKTGLFYDDGTHHAELFGRYVWWDLGPGAEEGRHNDMLWDLNLRRRWRLGDGAEADLFATLHNVFNGDQNTDNDRGTEERWVEGGVRVRF